MIIAETAVDRIKISCNIQEKYAIIFIGQTFLTGSLMDPKSGILKSEKIARKNSRDPLRVNKPEKVKTLVKVQD
jgi:hypothetical protein